jgi:hypothetical protein
LCEGKKNNKKKQKQNKTKQHKLCRVSVFTMCELGVLRLFFVVIEKPITGNRG